MKAKDFRQIAWQKLNGKWGTMALATFVYVIIISALEIVPYISYLALLLLSGAFILGYSTMALSVSRQYALRFEQVFEGFKFYGSSLALYLINSILTFLWSLLLIIPGIIKAYSYSMSFYILADNPQMSANDARKYSMELMYNNKWRLFCLHFSFIGWGVLGILTLGILYFWIIPYIKTAEAEFYRDLIQETNYDTFTQEAPFTPYSGENF